MTNGDDEQNQTVQGIGLPEDDDLRNRMRLQAALQSELDKKTDWLMQSEQDLLKIFRFYLLVLGAFISALSLLVVRTEVPLLAGPPKSKFNALLNLYTASAIFFWVVAVVGAIVAYVVIWSSMDVNELQRGDSSLKLPDLADNQAEMFSELELNDTLEQSPEDFEDEIIYNHIQSLRWTGNEFTKIRYPFLWGGMALVSISVLAFGFGIVHALTIGSELPSQRAPLRISPLPVHVVGLAVLFVGFVVSEFLVRQTQGVEGRIRTKIGSSRASGLFSVYLLRLLAKPFLKTCGKIYKPINRLAGRIYKPINRITGQSTTESQDSEPSTEIESDPDESTEESEERSAERVPEGTD